MPTFWGLGLQHRNWENLGFLWKMHFESKHLMCVRLHSRLWNPSPHSGGQPLLLQLGLLDPWEGRLWLDRIALRCQHRWLHTAGTKPGWQPWDLPAPQGSQCQAVSPVHPAPPPPEAGACSFPRHLPGLPCIFLSSSWNDMYFLKAGSERRGGEGEKNWKQDLLFFFFKGSILFFPPCLNAHAIW